MRMLSLHSSYPPMVVESMSDTSANTSSTVELEEVTSRSKAAERVEPEQLVQLIEREHLFRPGSCGALGPKLAKQAEDLAGRQPQRGSRVDDDAVAHLARTSAPGELVSCRSRTC